MSSLKKGVLLSNSYNSAFSGAPDERPAKMHVDTSWICSLVAEDAVGIFIRAVGKPNAVRVGRMENSFSNLEWSFLVSTEPKETKKNLHNSLTNASVLI